MHHKKKNNTKIFKQFGAFIRKEFYHVFRDKRTLLVMFALPAVQILLFGFALTNELKNANIMVVNQASSIESKEITDKIEASPFFTIKMAEHNAENVETYIKQGKIKAVVIFPENFGRATGKDNTVQLITEGTDPNIAKTIINYINAIIGDYQLTELNKNGTKMPFTIDVEVAMLYNPELNGSMMFIPGVIAMVMMIVCTTLTAVSVVREKEFGSFEVLLVSPLRPILVLISKALPYFVLSFANLIIILLMSKYILGVPLKGSVFLLMAESMLFILTCLTFGLLFSSIAETQAVAMLLSMMGMLLPTILFTGFIFPLENMPTFYQWLANIVPAKWYFIVVKDIMLKGVGFASIWKETAILGGMTITLTALSLLKFKKRMQ